MCCNASIGCWASVQDWKSKPNKHAVVVFLRGWRKRGIFLSHLDLSVHPEQQKTNILQSHFNNKNYPFFKKKKKLLASWNNSCCWTKAVTESVTSGERRRVWGLWSLGSVCITSPQLSHLPKYLPDFFSSFSYRFLLLNPVACLWTQRSMQRRAEETTICRK